MMKHPDRRQRGVMAMLIKVIYLDASAGEVDAKVLDGLISKGKIVAYQRSDGWVEIGKDPIRTEERDDS
jgi:hypothetical protein